MSLQPAPRALRLLKPKLKPAHRRAVLRALALCAVLLAALRLSFRVSLPSPPPLGGRSARLSRWPPPPCLSGRWASIPSSYSDRHFPYAILRDAVVDRRPLARERLPRGNPPGAVRILLFLTTHLSARHTRESSIVTIADPSLLGTVEYVAQMDREILPSMRPYSRNAVTSTGHQVSEWHVGLLLHPKPNADLDAVQRAVTANAQLHLTLRVVRFFDNSTSGIPLHLSVNLGCVLGWETPGLERRPPVCHHTTSDPADGAIALLSKPLYGDRKRDPAYFYEIAHWAARALFGPLRFDAVIIPVVVEHSVSEIEANCDPDDLSCKHGLLDINQDMMDRIATAVETELTSIHVPESAFARIMLVPACRLGSHANGTEKEDPCSASANYGQFYTAFSTYAMIAPFFKWAVSLDLDEFLSPVPLFGGVDSAPADSVLDNSDTNVGGAGDLSFPSLEFGVVSSDDVRNITSQLLHGKLPRLKDRKEIGASGGCYNGKNGKTWKGAVRCDRGLGLTTHHAAVRRDGVGLQVGLGKQKDSILRVWHARDATAQMRCYYDPPR